MTSKRYARVDADLGDTMPSSKLYSSQDYFERYEHISICSYLFISGPMESHLLHNFQPCSLIKTSKLQITGPLVFLRLMCDFNKPLEVFLRLIYYFNKPSEAFCYS